MIGCWSHEVVMGCCEKWVKKTYFVEEKDVAEDYKGEAEENLED